MNSRRESGWEFSPDLSCSTVFSFTLLLTHDPKADKGSVREPPPALGVLRVGGIPGRSGQLAGGTVDLRRPVVVRSAADHRRAIPPPAPLRHIAEHVVQAPRIRRFRPDRVG